MVILEGILQSYRRVCHRDSFATLRLSIALSSFAGSHESQTCDRHRFRKAMMGGLLARLGPFTNSDAEPRTQCLLKIHVTADRLSLDPGVVPAFVPSS
jgi:hypothetical protein